jgi:hypothetical protein
MVDNLTIDGYRQPGSSPNTNSILQPNSAKIKVVLDSRNRNYPSVTRNGSTLLVGWTGGTGSFQVQNRTSLSSPWEVDPTAVYSGNSATVTINGAEGYCRIQGQ